MIRFEAGQDAMKSHRPANVRDAMRVRVRGGRTKTRRRVTFLAAMDRAGVDELPIVSDRGEFRAMVERRVGREENLYDRGDERGRAGRSRRSRSPARTPRSRSRTPSPDARAAERRRFRSFRAAAAWKACWLLDDVRHVPDLVEAVDERSQREAADEAGGRPSGC
jgi:hypothetical protein